MYIFIYICIRYLRVDPKQCLDNFFVLFVVQGLRVSQQVSGFQTPTVCSLESLDSMLWGYCAYLGPTSANEKMTWFHCSGPTRACPERALANEQISRFHCSGPTRAVFGPTFANK